MTYTVYRRSAGALYVRGAAVRAAGCLHMDNAYTKHDRCAPIARGDVVDNVLIGVSR